MTTFVLGYRFFFTQNINGNTGNMILGFTLTVKQDNSYYYGSVIISRNIWAKFLMEIKNTAMYCD